MSLSNLCTKFVKDGKMTNQVITIGNLKIDLSKLKNGIKQTDLKNEKEIKIFQKFDQNSNGILEQDELTKLLESLGNYTEDNKITNKESRDFIKRNGLKGEIKRADLQNFLSSLASQSENIDETFSSFWDDGTETVNIRHNAEENGTVQTDCYRQNNGILHAKITKNGNNEVTEYYGEDGTTLTKKEEKLSSGDVVVTEYDSDGTTPTKKITRNTSSNTVSTIVYSDGKPSTEQVKRGTTTTENYKYDENGANKVLNSKVENEGIPAREKRTDYTYNEDGTVKVEIKEAGKTTVQILKDDIIQSEVITEGDKTTTRTYTDGRMTNELITESDKRTESTFNEDGSRVETATYNNGNTAVTEYNDAGHRTSQTKVVDGTTYQVEYDGEGNTKGVIVQNGESPAMVARRFGVNLDELIAVNQDKIKGNAPNQYFLVGAEIKIPGEIDADRFAEMQAGRDSKETAINKYNAFIESQQDRFTHLI